MLFKGPIIEAIGITEKSDMKIGQNFDPLLKGIFKCRMLENETTNS